MFNRVSAEKLQQRLDADFYKKELIANDELLKASGAVRLSSLIDVTKSSYGVLPKSEEYVTSGVPLIRGGDLIEGQLTEAELIVAEQALQVGNDQLDRCILNHLKTDGVDGQGAALYGDLDELYRLLAQANGNEESDA